MASFHSMKEAASLLSQGHRRGQRDSCMIACEFLIDGSPPPHRRKQSNATGKTYKKND
ncbi:hypothetical protein [Rhizobium sp. 2MFCol3.1]|uniref:hypothetical protein n=1 Tax=Rhizobium sp. 2MFCol3.1 TaxID=1246459 RepID=UPI0012DF770B|nr:hypothetical protein [Rhizobium sp. 2MFCol3.1]